MDERPSSELSESPSSNEREGHDFRTQARGGGKAGAAELEPIDWLASGNSISIAGSSLTTTPCPVLPVRLKHFSAHPAIEPQSFIPLLSQCFPGGQQSEWEEDEVWTDFACPIALAIGLDNGKAATAKAMEIIKMARNLLTR